MLLTPSCLHTRARPLTRPDTQYTLKTAACPLLPSFACRCPSVRCLIPHLSLPNLFHPARLLSTFPHPPAPFTSRPPLRFPSSPARFLLPALRARVPSTHCPLGSFHGRFVPADHFFSTSSFDSFFHPSKIRSVGSRDRDTHVNRETRNLVLRFHEAHHSPEPPVALDRRRYTLRSLECFANPESRLR